ncbi:hypothetical protein, partial [Salmonella enterica]|uniref:hypothetical protein n=1 Tax=Salmonella enterica TaxID=28901 RepID=UPI00398C6E39
IVAMTSVLEVPGRRGTVQNAQAVGLGRLFSRQGRRYGCGEVANVRIVHISHGDQPLDSAIVVDDQSDFIFIALKFNQLRT